MSCTLFLGGLVLAGILLFSQQETAAIIVFVIGSVVAALPARFTTGELVNKSPGLNLRKRATYAEMTGAADEPERQRIKQEFEDAFKPTKWD